MKIFLVIDQSLLGDNSIYGKHYNHTYCFLHMKLLYVLYGHLYIPKNLQYYKSCQDHTLVQLIGLSWIQYNLVVLYDYSTVQPFTKTKLQNFESILSFYDCRAGISLEFHDLYSLPQHYQTACNALFTGQKLNIKKSIIQYSDIVFQHILLTYANHNDLSSLIHPAITLLQEKEPDKSDMFLQTIDAYIENGLKIVPTAKFLSVHYNTVKYRLNRIVELTDLNFSNAYTIFQLQLSLIILDIKKRLEH